MLLRFLEKHDARESFGFIGELLNLDYSQRP